MLINSFRKLAGLVVHKFESNVNFKYFKHFQLGIGRNLFGMVSIIHCMSALLQDRPTLDFMFAYFQNVFNLVRR